jgi:hypothetical protein
MRKDATRLKGTLGVGQTGTPYNISSRLAQINAL